MSRFITNSFQVPNAFIDDVLTKISGNACKIYLLIIRKTRGWNKEADRISYSQVQKLTGIGSSATVDKAVSELVDLGLIFYKKGNEKSANEYRLNDEFCTSKNEVGGTSKNEVATSKNEVGGTSKNEDTEIHSFKNTKQKTKSEYDTHTHAHESEAFEAEKNPKGEQAQSLDKSKTKRKSKSTKSEATACPDKIIYTSHQLEKCQKHNFDIDDLFDDFKNWHNAKGIQYKCWVSAFTMWIKKEIKFTANKQPITNNFNQTNFKDAFRDPAWENIYGDNFYPSSQENNVALNHHGE